jgi:hypothetical protein
MIWFDITCFPKFMKDFERNGWLVDEAMRRMGYKSAIFEANGTMCAWGLSEEEYTWFILRWS